MIKWGSSNGGLSEMFHHGSVLFWMMILGGTNETLMEQTFPLYPLVNKQFAIDIGHL
jgi:hypothetical protein